MITRTDRLLMMGIVHQLQGHRLVDEMTPLRLERTYIAIYRIVDEQFTSLLRKDITGKP